ncbi:hypothetical protein R3P38DRAFT_2835223 [Favolaschia claudopus]|uniref:Uncharacterized protein n=1 Tax=Favolaschia claudopus TaxID=2862362 RepID=A0AAW0EE81_9AGAR
MTAGVEANAGGFDRPSKDRMRNAGYVGRGEIRWHLRTCPFHRRSPPTSLALHPRRASSLRSLPSLASSPSSPAHPPLVHTAPLPLFPRLRPDPYFRLRLRPSRFHTRHLHLAPNCSIRGTWGNSRARSLLVTGVPSSNLISLIVSFSIPHLCAYSAHTLLTRPSSSSRTGASILSFARLPPLTLADRLPLVHAVPPPLFPTSSTPTRTSLHFHLRACLPRRLALALPSLPPPRLPSPLHPSRAHPAHRLSTATTRLRPCLSALPCTLPCFASALRPRFRHIINRSCPCAVVQS